ncbi:sodium/glutamate symporter [Enterovirga rhinocerotis]|uniref:Sodium/glutamate symporter n=1 Tax=Enterovirga rhinocerotis TaxID=1339210 RepID=A0A4R7BK30_9HYPH|nr:sodium/glutamate symporter [Enterovirga rhinocerotis]TDR85383.1 ESS family glutamate:Na+ symporter [Enterovirga rhinocerotis]
MTIDAFISFTIAVTLLLIGKIVTLNVRFLQKYSIPEAVIGGFLCVALVTAAYVVFGTTIEFDLNVRDFLLLAFFAGIGLKADIRSLIAGGRPLVVLLLLAVVFILLQNTVGLAIAPFFGLDPLAGLMLGSISLTGGIGTTLAWAPVFTDRLGVANAMELGIAGNTGGLIAACVIGGPIATYLMRRHAIAPPPKAGVLDIGAAAAAGQAPLDYFCVLWAMLAINVSLIAGFGISRLIALSGLTVPTFVSCLIAGILIRNLMPYTVGATVRRIWPRVEDGLSLVMDLSLGIFLTMALMGLQLWQLHGALVFVAVVLTIQIVLTIAYTVGLVFRLMGRDYEAAVICAGFGGITLGSTATAIANMTAVAQQHGPAPRAFIIVPLVCGFFIDIVNAIIVSAFVG